MDEATDFKIVVDRIDPNDQHREIEIRYLPSDLALEGHSGSRGDVDHMVIDAFDDDGNPMLLSGVVVPSNIDLTDAAERKRLFAELRAMLAKAGLLVE